MGRVWPDPASGSQVKMGSPTDTVDLIVQRHMPMKQHCQISDRVIAMNGRLPTVRVRGRTARSADFGQNTRGDQCEWRARWLSVERGKESTSSISKMYNSPSLVIMTSRMCLPECEVSGACCLWLVRCRRSFTKRVFRSEEQCKLIGYYDRRPTCTKSPVAA